MGLEEPRIVLGRKERETYSANWADIRENDRLIDAYCEKYGQQRKDMGPFEREHALEQAKKEGL